MPDIVTRYTKGSALTHEQLDDHVGEHNLTYSSATLTLDQTHNREHIIVQSGCTAIEFTATATISAALDQTASSTPIGWTCAISNNSGATITINSGAVQFNGGTGTYDLTDNSSILLGFDDVSATKGYFIIAQYSLNTSFSDVNNPVSIGTGTDKTVSTTGTVEEIQVALSGVSIDTTGNVQIQLGTSSTLQTTGYTGVAADTGGDSAISTGFDLVKSSLSASNTLTGIVSLSHLGSNIWVASGVLYGVTRAQMIAGTVTLSGALDIVGVVATAGNFDAGTIKITYQRSA